MSKSARSPFRRIVLAVAALLVAAAAAAPAAAQAQKIGVIDTERVLTASEVGKAALEGLTALRTQKQQQGEALQQELTDLQTRLQEGRLSLSEDKLAELQRQAEDKALAMRRFQDDANRELAKKRDEVLAEVDQKVMPVINQYGQANGFDMIFRKFESGLIYVSDAIDVTDEVIAQLDAGAGA